jgi:deoxycytidine triphosphate deaminase
MVVWSGKKVAEHVTQPPEVKIGPNGVELKVSEVWKVHPETISIVNGKTRTTSIEKKQLAPDQDGYYNLENGIYEVRIANEVSIPEKAVGKMHPRSTLNRLGAIKSETGLWDSGYKGYGTQTIFIPIKMFRIHKDDFWFQIHFEDSENSDISYADTGFWHGETPDQENTTKKKTLISKIKGKIINSKQSN